MSRHSRWFQVSVLVVVTALAWCQPQTASAWFGRWQRGFYGAGFRPWCGPVFGPRVYGGWGRYGGWYGGTRFAFSDSVSIGGPFGGLFSGAVSSYVINPWNGCGVRGYGWNGCGWRGYGWNGCGWRGYGWNGCGWGGGYGWNGYYPYGYGCWGYQPIVVSPYPGSFGPVYGPAGVLPYMGLSASVPARVSTGLSIAGTVPPPAPQLALGRAAPAAPVAAIAVRASNGVARLRAARLVAVGDRHMRTALHDSAKLASALDAYRRAATIAPDQADTFLRQAIVLTALERTDDAAKAVDRAVAIDARLGDDAVAAVAAQERLPPDPVFGDRPDTGPTTLISRSSGLLARIFAEEPVGAGRALPAVPNWIATRWSQQWQGQVNAVAAR
jgi:hypothetical protein